jgi:hypothetical protein
LKWERFFEIGVFYRREAGWQKKIANSPVLEKKRLNPAVIQINLSGKIEVKA